MEMESTHGGRESTHKGRESTQGRESIHGGRESTQGRESPSGEGVHSREGVHLRWSPLEREFLCIVNLVVGQKQRTKDGPGGGDLQKHI